MHLNVKNIVAMVAGAVCLMALTRATLCSLSRQIKLQQMRRRQVRRLRHPADMEPGNTAPPTCHTTQAAAWQATGQVRHHKHESTNSKAYA